MRSIARCTGDERKDVIKYLRDFDHMRGGKNHLSSTVVCIALGLMYACLRGANAGEADGKVARAADALRITTLCDDLPLMSVLNDVLTAYGLPAVVVFRPEDADVCNARKQDVLVSEVPPAEFFRRIVQLFPGYICDYDAETSCWFVAPDDGSAAAFSAVVQCRVSGPVTLTAGVGAFMDGLPNSRRVPPAGEELSFEGEKMEREPHFGFASYEREDCLVLAHQLPFFAGSNATYEITGAQCVRWKGIGQCLQKVPHTFLFVYMLTNACESDLQLSGGGATVRDHAGMHQSGVDVSSAKVGETSGVHRAIVTNIYWSLSRVVDCSTMSDREIVDVWIQSKAHYTINWQMAAQLLRMSEKRLWELYELTPPDLRRNVFTPLMSAPQVMYNDAIIRMAIEWIGSTKFGVPPLYVLINNCYSTEMQQFVTALLSEQSLYWKGEVYSVVKYAPAYIPLAVRKGWVAEVEPGWRDRRARNLERSCRSGFDVDIPGITPERMAMWRQERVVSEETKAKMKAIDDANDAFQTTPERLRSVEIAREARDRRSLRHLRVLGVDTNRSFSWVWQAAGLVAPTNKLQRDSAAKGQTF